MRVHLQSLDRRTTRIQYQPAPANAGTKQLAGNPFLVVIVTSAYFDDLGWSEPVLPKPYDLFEPQPPSLSGHTERRFMHPLLLSFFLSKGILPFVILWPNICASAALCLQGIERRRSQARIDDFNLTIEAGLIHPKAMPVTLTTPEEVDAWLDADSPEAPGLQRQLPDDALAPGEKEDRAPEAA